MRSALVTGASRGIGRGIAFELARQGLGLTVSSRSQGDLAELAPALLDAGAPRVVCHAADLAHPDEVDAIVEAHGDAYEGLDMAVLSGGVGTGGPFEGIARSRIDKTVAVNLTSTVLLLQRALPLLRAAASRSDKGARIVLLSSITGLYAEPGLAVYGATKAALLSLAETLNAEESANGVMATAVAPAYVATDMSAWATDAVPADTMIPVADVVAVVRMLLELGRTTSLTRVVLSRSGTSGYVA